MIVRVRDMHGMWVEDCDLADLLQYNSEEYEHTYDRLYERGFAEITHGPGEAMLFLSVVRS